MKTILTLLAGALALAAQPRYDLLLQGGHVIDPKNKLDRVADVAVAAGKIARVAAGIPPAEARRVVDARGLYVTPGLIDIHVHLYPRTQGRSEAVDPDAFSFRGGVTTMVDAGTTGWRDFPDFRDRYIARAKTRVFALLNIVGGGIGTGTEDNPDDMDAEATAKMARANPGVVVGFKSAHYAGPGWISVERAVAAGKATDMPVMVDFGQITKDRQIDTLFMDKLRPGDIFTHCYSGHREETLADGTVNPAMVAGRKRGIIFDLGHGSGSFFWYVAVPAYRQGFYPDSISTDLHINSMNGGVKEMTYVMSKVLDLGSPLAEVIRMSTWAPALQIKHPELGNLDVGAEADIAVLRLEKGKFGYVDSVGARRAGTVRLTTELTLRKGVAMWDLNGMAADDWEKYPYHKGPYLRGK
jgi:dihydroorotase